MLDILDFVEEKGGDPRRIRESQRRRHAPETIVDDVLALYEDHKKSMRPSVRKLVEFQSLIAVLQLNTQLHRSDHRLTQPRKR